jgi:hypothetical protein
VPTLPDLTGPLGLPLGGSPDATGGSNLLDFLLGP